MSQWLAQVIERAGNVDDWLASARSKALAELKQKEWPGRRTEAWRYTSLHKVADLNLATTSNETTAEAPQVEGLNSIDLVFVDGRLTSDMTNLVLPEGVPLPLWTRKATRQKICSDKLSHSILVRLGQ